jgi:hypothetical protein
MCRLKEIVILNLHCQASNPESTHLQTAQISHTCLTSFIYLHIATVCLPLIITLLPGMCMHAQIICCFPLLAVRKLQTCRKGINVISVHPASVPEASLTPAQPQETYDPKCPQRASYHLYQLNCQQTTLSTLHFVRYHPRTIMQVSVNIFSTLHLKL